MTEEAERVATPDPGDSEASSEAPARESERARPRSARRRKTRRPRRSRLAKLPKRVQRGFERFRRRYPTLAFLGAFLFLNAMLNVRYPGREPALWYLLPSLDLLGVFLYLAWFGSLRWEVPRALSITVVAAIFGVRMIRLGDGIQDRFFASRFHLYPDLPNLPELARFVLSGLGPVLFALAVLGTLLFIAALLWLTRGALALCGEYLREKRHVYWAVALTAGLAFIGWSIPHKPNHDALFWKGGLAASVLPRLRDEAAFLFNVYGHKAERAQLIESTAQHLREIPNDLAKLQGANVHLILIESYGQCVLEWPPHVRAMNATFDRFEATLTKKGFGILTSFLDSPTYGGQSWLAHATIGTGVKTTNQLDYEVIMLKKPKSIASFFRRAGYRTVLAAPGTSRPWPQGEFYAFDQQYFGWQYGYEGPWFAWARMPDQYVLDFVRRRELASPTKPLFIQYQLISSHAPWSDIPRIAPDWDGLGDGRIFDKLGRVRYAVEWPNFENAADAYAHSIRYDFEVLEQFIERYIQDGSLIILMGDHQPVWDVNGHSDAMGVPIHLLSRNRALLEPFKKLGYSPGLRKTPHGPYPGLETFLPDLLMALSESAR